MSHTSTPQAPRPRLAHHRSPPSPEAHLDGATTTDETSLRDTLIPLSPRGAPATRTASTHQEEKRCWICYSTDAEETPPRQDWKAPCKCSLVAHESCLLDWIADMQKSGQSTADKLACPQCKTPIKLREQHSLVLEVVDKLGRVTGKAGAFIAFGGVASVLFVACTVYGVNTVYTMCGSEHASEILLGADSEFSWTWRLGVGLPLIPFVLIASRTRAFDSILPVLPVMFFCHTDPLHFTLPPSPAISLALLPYVRAAYNGVWRRCISPYEERWLKDVTPTFALENAEEQQRQQQRRRAGNDNRHRNRRGANGNHAPVEVEVEVADAGEAPEWDGEVRLENHNIFVQGSNVTTMVLGALLWPTIARAAGSGVLGRWPAAWGGDRLRRWFPSQLVRNIVGGLIVVVLKDFISLYCKYKRAQQFRTRRVMNYSEVHRMKGRRTRP